MVNRPTASTAGRVAVGFAGGVLLAGIAFATLYLGFAVAYGVCSGDGGSPFSAQASVAGRFCDGSWSAVWAFWLLVPAASVLVGTIVAVVRRTWHPLGVALAAAVAALALSLVPLALPQNCSDPDDSRYECMSY